MSACPRPSVKVKHQAPSSTGSYTADHPTPREAACNATNSTVEKQGSGSTTITNTSPDYPTLPAQPCVLGFKFEGAWEAGKAYKKQTCFINPNGSVVRHGGSTWLCIADHTSGTGLEPTIDDPTPPSVNGSQYWEIWAEGQSDLDKEKAKVEAEKSWLDKVTDWVKDMDIWDWLKVAAVAGGLIYAGVKLLDQMGANGEGDGNADQRYNGSPGYSGTYTKPTLRAVLTTLCDYGSIDSDVSAISSTETVEFTIASTTSVRTVLQQLSIAFNFDMVNSGGILKFVPRTPSIVETLTIQDLGFSANALPPAPYTSKRFQGISLPRKINVTYFSPSLDGNNYTQSAELFTYAEGNEISVNIPIALTDAQARKIAELSLTNAHLERMNYKFTTSYKFIHLEPSDTVDSPMGIIRITKMNEVEDGLLQFEACDAGEPSASALSNLAYSTPNATGNTDATLGYSASIFIDPPWTDVSDTGIRLFSVVHGYGKPNWPGAMIYVSRDNGSTYNQMLTVTNESTFGKANAILAAPNITTSGADTGWDVANTLSVTLKTGTLTSTSDADVVAGANRLYVGQELIAFGVATLTAPNTYTLSRLKRGLTGTLQFGSTHGADELVTLASTLVRVPLLESDYKKTLKFKTVTVGSTLAVADEDTVEVVSNNNKLWAPTLSSATFNSTDNSWVLVWTENIRSPDVFNNGASTLTQVDADQAGWGVAILDSSSNVVSTRPVGYKTYTYTAAEQAADFGSVQSHIKAVVVPMHTRYGGGYPLTINT